MKTWIYFFLFLNISSFAQQASYNKKLQLRGLIERKVFPGQPNYEDIKNGDKEEVYWVLKLDRTLEVISGNQIFEEEERNVEKIQLVMTKEDFNKYSFLLGKKVIVFGKLFHSHSGHHKTRILLELEKMSKQ